MKVLFLLLTGVCAAQCSFWGEAIYWRPTAGEMTYIAQLTGPSAFRAAVVAPRYAWGFRVGGSWRCLELAGTYVGQDRSTITSGALSPMLPFVGGGGSEVFTGARARARLRISYWDLALRVCCPMGAFALVGGVRYVDIHNRVNVDLMGTITVAGTGPIFLKQMWRNEFSGVGPEMGLRGCVSLPYGFVATGECSAVALMGSRGTEGRTILTDNPPVNRDSSFRPGHCSGTFPGVISRLDLSYSTCWIRFAVGYDLLHFWNVTSVVVEGSAPDPSAVGGAVAQSWGLAGPSLSVGVYF